MWGVVLSEADFAVTDADTLYEGKKFGITFRNSAKQENSNECGWSRGPNECGYIEINS